MSQNNKMPDFEMYRRTSVENCSFGIFYRESAMLTLVLKQIMLIVILQALMGQNLPKLMVN